MRIGKISKITGFSTDTIRRLEREGVITPRRDWNGHRRFTEEDLKRLKEVLFNPRRRPLKSFMERGSPPQEGER